MSLAISKPTPDSLNESIALVLSADQKKPIDAKNITPSKRINEQESYAVLVHHTLRSSKPKLAQRFEKELKLANDTFKKNHKTKSDMFKVSDRLMRQYVREKELSQDEYKTIKYEAFGLAQLDSNRSRISNERLQDTKDGDTPVRAISTFYKKLETNQTATIEEFAQFRAFEAEISKTKWHEKHPSLSGTEATSNIESDDQTNTIKNVATNNLPSGFLWKPQSDSDGRLVVLLPPSITNSVNSVRLKSPNGSTDLDTGRYGGIGNGMRLHFRFSKSGSSYPDGTIVEVLFTDGNKLRIPISETSARIEST